jgi:carboxypeptidase Taq
MTAAANHLYDQLLDHTRQTMLLGSIESLLSWDERCVLPPAAFEYRAEQMTYLAGMLHEKRTDPRVGDWLAGLADAPLAADPESETGATIRELKRQYDRRTRLPTSLVQELTRTSVLAQQAWVDARKNNDFAALAPWLEKTFLLKREEADALGYAECRYDALLDDYEPGESTAQVARTLSALRDALVPLVGEIRASGRSPDIGIVSRSYPLAAQQAFGREVAARLGFDFERGRLDVTAHPFCMAAGPHDHRITTRYDEQFFPSAFFGTLHEAGHGMYDQGLAPDQFGLPLGDAVSLGIHESQSRMWENLVGRSRPFWEHFFPSARRYFPEALADVSLDAFYYAVNDVRPSLIRVEADEATYNLHILVRFELEQALLEDELAVRDLPGAWRERYRGYLGIEPPDDADGAMQDIHWSAGLVGYFPTYSLGNLYAAQFYARADADLGGLDAAFARGEFQPLLEWLRDKIHQPGKRFSAGRLVERTTGKPLSPQPLLAHLRRKLAPLYGLSC